MNILMIEDDENTQYVLSEYLKFECDIDSFIYSDSVETSIDILKHNHFDIILIDYYLKDGKADSLIPYLPKDSITILMSAHPKARLGFEQMKTNFYCEKPFDEASMNEIINLINNKTTKKTIH